MQPDKARRNYLIGAVIVWLGIIMATVITLEGSDDLSTMLIILAGGAFWFIVIAPQLFNRHAESQTLIREEGEEV